MWAWWLECKAGLGCCDDWMLCAKHWASGGWLNAWENASGLMTVTLCVAYGHVVWAVVLMGCIEHRPSLSKNVWEHVVWATGGWAEAPRSTKTWVVHVQHVQWRLPSSY